MHSADIMSRVAAELALFAGVGFLLFALTSPTLRRRKATGRRGGALPTHASAGRGRVPAHDAQGRAHG